jgi:NTP pyrophosphatase (non-canonical NTP hydrolase)
MDIKELSKFIDRTLDKWRYPVSEWYSDKDRVFAQMIKISEEAWELSEQILWKFWWQRLSKKDKISDEKLKNEVADVILATVRLWRLLDLNIERLLEKKMEILKHRFNNN